MKTTYKYIAGLFAVSVMAVSCSSDNTMLDDEKVKVSFCAGIEGDAATAQARGTSVVSTADKMICTVFHGNEEIAGVRDTFNITTGEPVYYTPALVKGQDYVAAFWAMKAGAYDTENMKSVTRNTNVVLEEPGFDAFTNSVTVHVGGSSTQSVMLKRPLARINMCVAEEKLIELIDSGVEPTRIAITVSDVHSAYNAVEKKVTGNSKTHNFSLPILNENITIDGKAYRVLSSNYVFAGNETTVNVSCTVYARISGSGQWNVEQVVCSKNIDNVFLQENYNTNLLITF